MGYTLDHGMSENDIKTTLISEEEKFVRSGEPLLRRLRRRCFACPRR